MKITVAIEHENPPILIQRVVEIIGEDQLASADSPPAMIYSKLLSMVAKIREEMGR